MKRILLTALVFALTLTMGCESCDKKPATPIPPPQPPPVEKAVDMGQPDKGDPLKEAKAKAVEAAELAALSRNEIAAAVAGDIEANSKRNTTKVRSPKSYGSCRGKVDPKAVKKVFNRYSSYMKKCYERALKKNPGLEGKVKVSVTIGTDGKVKKTKVGGSLNNASVSKCIQMETKKMKFPNAEGGCVVVNKSYTFSPDF